MVEANADPEVVTAVIRRETQEAAAARAVRLTNVAPPTHGHLSSPPPMEGKIVVEPVRPTSSVPASSGLWNTQLVGSLALVVVLFFVWIAERRSRRKGEKYDGER